MKKKSKQEFIFNHFGVKYSINNNLKIKLVVNEFTSVLRKNKEELV